MNTDSAPGRSIYVITIKGITQKSKTKRQRMMDRALANLQRHYKQKLVMVPLKGEVFHVFQTEELYEPQQKS